MQKIKGFPHTIDKHGNVYSPRGFKLKQFKNKRGYMRVTLTYNGKKYNRMVHRLVALVYLVNDRDPLYYNQVHHKDFDKTNNNLCNLEWVSCKENKNRLIAGCHGCDICNTADKII